MPQVISSDNQRMAIRMSADDKAILAKAAALNHSNITEFVLQLVLPKAREIVAQHEARAFSRDDVAFMMQLLDNPPSANARLQKAKRDFMALHHE